MRHLAVILLYPNVHNQTNNQCFDINGNSVLVDEALVQAKIAELQTAEPMRLLRIERNEKLAGSDWRMHSDYPGPNQEKWKTYRQALRDLPVTAEPQLDDVGNVTNVNWPEEPNA